MRSDVPEMNDAPAPDGVGDDDLPNVEPKSSRGWLAIIEDARKAFEDYQTRADNIDKLYANLGSLSAHGRDRQFQLFWANVQVLGPSIYARPPIPVVVPKFKDRRPLYRTASEFLERCTSVAFDLAGIDAVMMLLRDDLAIQARGVAWVRYETKGESETESERVCIEHVDRKDFLHDPARKWAEVGWVGRRSWLTKKEMRKRFRKHSGNAYQDAEYTVQKGERDNGAADSRQKAAVWEVWSRDENKVVWVSPGCDKLLDEGKPHLTLEGFFPCPRPAYATIQRGSLIPVPDVIYYKDQLEEINELTGRIHALAQSIKVRGFYPAGVADIADAVEAAINSLDDRKVLIPVSNWAAFGSAGDPIVWLPLEMIANVITQLVELRKQLIDDVYQIMGLSDIMRGSTEASETLGAQQLKSQYGSIRIRDKQSELVRIARDLVRIAAEIMAENFGRKTLVEMAQMEIPTDAQISKQIADLKQRGEAMLGQQMAQAQQNPELMEQAQANPAIAQQMLEGASAQIAAQLRPEIEKAQAQPTVEKVITFLKDERTRPFVLDIESDSTIQPDENMEKQTRTEFLTALSGALQQMVPMLQMQPQAGPFAGQVLKFALAPFRAGRELDGAVDELVEQLGQQAQQPRPDPAAEAAKAKAVAEQERIKAEMAIKQQDAQLRQQEFATKSDLDAKRFDAEMAGKQAEASAKSQEAAARLAVIEAQGRAQAQKHAQEMERGGLELEKLRADIARVHVQAGATMQSAEISAQQAQQEAKEKDAA